MSRNETFVRNLNVLCAEKRSVAEVCRALGFNRQQFARYLSGEALPSPHNLKRIAEGFGVAPDDLLATQDIASVRRFRGMLYGGRAVDSLFRRAFPGDIARLRPMLGYHHMYFMEPFEPDRIIRSLVHVHERDDHVFTKTVERLADDSAEMQYFAKYEGMMSLHGTLLFLLEMETTKAGAIVESIFVAPATRKIDILTGLTLGVTSETYSWPFASPIAIKFLGKEVDIRKRLTECGSIQLEDRRLDPRIRALFQGHRKSEASTTFAIPRLDTIRGVGSP